MGAPVIAQDSRGEADAADAAPDTEESARARSALRRTATWSIISFSACVTALIVAAIVMSDQFTGSMGPYLWAMVVMGALIMAAVLIAILVPFLQETRPHRH